MSLLISSSFLIAFLFAQFGFGNFLFKVWAQRRSQSSTVGLGTILAVGQIATGSILLPLALVSQFNKSSVIVITICGVLVGYFFVEKSSFTNRLRNFKLLATKFRFLETMVILLTLAPQFIRLISRPVSDALAYYLVQPKLIALTNQLTPVNRFEAFLQSSAHIELNGAAVFTYSGEIGMRSYTFLSGIILFRVIWEICHQFNFGQLATKVTMFLLATSTFLMNTVADGKTDNISSLWLMAAFATLATGLHERNHKLLVLFGAVLGFSLLSKISFLVLIPALTYYLLRNLNQRSIRNIAPYIFSISMGLLLPIFLNLLKNQIVFSAPLAPFLNHTGEPSTQLFSQEWFSFENTMWIVATYPLGLLFGQYPMQYGNLTPFAVLGMPILYVMRTLDRYQKRHAIDLLFMGLVTVCLWVLLKPSVLAPRYISPALIFIVMALGLFASKNFENMRSRLIKAMVLVLALGHVSLAALLAMVIYDSTFYTASQNAESKMYNYVNNLPNEAGRVYLDSFNASMLSNDSLLCSSVVHRFYFQDRLSTKLDIWDDLYRQGFRFVVSDKSTHKELGEIKAVSNRESKSIIVTQLNFSKNYVLYKITSKNPDIERKHVNCLKP